MGTNLRTLAAAGVFFCTLWASDTALAQKSGGVLKVYFFDSPASMSIHEEATIAAEGPMMGVFNNLVMYKQDVPQSGFQSIVPDLATDWSWDEDKTQLTFRLREGVKWHDGKPFTAKDVVCTWDLLTGRSSEKLRINPRKAWYRNFEEVVPNGDSEITFRLKRPQPSFIVLLASGFTPIYPCHVSPRDMRSHPIGTGPFKFVEFKPNEVIRVTRNPEYWKKGRPYLDGIEYTIIRNPSTGILAFVAGKVDITSPFFLQVPLLKDAKRQDPEATCALVPSNVNRNVMMNREAVPFDKPELRRAVALTVDRKAFVDTLTEGKGDFGGAMLPPPEGVWGMPADMLKTLPGYNPDVPKNRAEARGIMEKLGYGPDKRLKLTVSTRNIPPYRDPAVILIDQLKEIYIDGELDPIDTAQWLPRIHARRLYHRLEPDRQRARRPGPDALRKFHLRCRGQLRPVLQSRTRQDGRSAINGVRPGQAQGAGMGDRAQAGGRGGQADPLAQSFRHLLAPLCQGLHPDDQQHLQWIANGGRVARQIATRSWGGDNPA